MPHLGMAVLPANVPFGVEILDDHELVAVDIAPEFVPESLTRSDGGIRWSQAHAARDPLAAHIILALLEDARGSSPSGSLLAESLAMALLARFSETAPQAPALCPTPSLGSQRLRRVLEYIAAHLDSDVTLRTLSSVVGMDHYQFGRAFKLCTGMSPHQYVMQARIDRAKQLLQNRTLSITEIAVATGFATPSHFSLTFRRLARVTPREYRDALP